MILLFYLLQNRRHMLCWISRQAALEAALIVRPLRHRLLLTQNKVMIRHVRLDKRSLLFQKHPADPPQAASRSSSVAPTEFYSGIAKAHGRVNSQLGDNQYFMFWNTMGKHNLVLWLDYTEEATSYHTLDMSVWGAVRYRRRFSCDDCNMVQMDHCH